MNTNANVWYFWCAVHHRFLQNQLEWTEWKQSPAAKQENLFYKINKYTTRKLHFSILAISIQKSFVVTRQMYKSKVECVIC